MTSNANCGRYAFVTTHGAVHAKVFSDTWENYFTAVAELTHDSARLLGLGEALPNQTFVNSRPLSKHAAAACTRPLSKHAWPSLTGGLSRGTAVTAVRVSTLISRPQPP